MTLIGRRFLTAEGADGGGEAQTIDFEAHQPAIVAFLREKGFEVGTKEDIQKGINEAVGKTHKDWEGTLSTILGEQKPDGKKGLEWAKESLPSKIKSKESTEKQQTEVEKPENKIKDDEAQARIKALEEKLNEVETSRKNEAEAEKKKSVNLGITTGLESFKFNRASAEEEELVRANVLQSVTQNYKAVLNEQGKLVFYKGEEIEIDKSTMKPITLDGIVKRDFGWAILAEKEAPKGGSGTNKESVITKVIDGQQVIVASSVTALREELSAKSLRAGSKEYNDVFFASCKHNGLDPLAAK